MRQINAGSEAREAEAKKPGKVMIFVEPSPFSHVSGMRNRFLGLIDSLTDEGDEVCRVKIPE
jgi:sulfoquinovosyltransferase